MRVSSRKHPPSYSAQRLSFYKAILGLAIVTTVVSAATATVPDPWSDLLAGDCDLATVLRIVEQPVPMMAEGFAADGSLEARMKLGLLQIHQGSPQEAIPTLEAALAMADSVGDERAHTFASLQLGRALVHTRQVDRAGGHLAEALDGAAGIGVPLWEGDAAIALSVLARWRMDFDESLAFREQALAAYESIGYREGQARALHYIGTIHVFGGDLTRAMATLQRALAVARDCDFDVEIAGSLVELAGVNFLLGDFDRALAQYEEAAALTAHPWRKGQIELNQGSLLADQDRHPEALPYFERALEAMRQVGDHRSEAQIVEAIGRSLCDLKDYETGLARLDEAIALAREWQVPMTEAYALHYKGFGLLGADRPEEALVALARADSLAAGTGYFDIIESCARGRALVARRRGRHDEALAHLDAALAVVDDVRRRAAGSASIQAGYFSQTRETFDEVIDLLGEMHAADPDAGHDRRAFAVAQQAKARSLLDLLSESEVDLRCRADEAFQTRERELLDGIAAALDAGDAGAVAHLETELDLLEVELRAADPRYAELRYPQPCSLARLQDEVLREGEVLLEYHLGKKSSFVWAVTRADFTFEILPAADELEAQVATLLPLLGDYNLLGEEAAYYTAAVMPLSRVLLDPARGAIDATDHVVVVPDGALHYLPFEALLLEETDARRFGDLPWLIGEAAVTRAPSISALERLRGAAGVGDATLDLLLVADPAEGEEGRAGVFARVAGATGVGAVPNVDEEINGVTASFDDAAVRVLRGAEATLTALRTAGAGGVGIVHFATHGIFNERSPRFSGLVLAAGSDDDGFLTAGEIFGLRLDCGQVVLSACSSALGERISGEGLVGLTRAFFYAGARSVVAALWDVAGAGASVFMTEYYARLDPAGDDPAGCAAALARTKRAMIAGEVTLPDGASAAHPCFWAPFVLSGR